MSNYLLRWMITRRGFARRIFLNSVNRPLVLPISQLWPFAVYRHFCETPQKERSESVQERLDFCFVKLERFVRAVVGPTKNLFLTI